MIELTADTLHLDGELRVTGGDSAGPRAGGGAGGSVNVQVCIALFVPNLHMYVLKSYRHITSTFFMKINISGYLKCFFNIMYYLYFINLNYVEKHQAKLKSNSHR